MIISYNINEPLRFEVLKKIIIVTSIILQYVCAILDNYISILHTLYFNS